jgi:anti-sigma B factor antagonist
VATQEHPSTEGPERPPEPFTVEVRPDRKRVVLVPRGELDLASVDDLRGELDGLVNRGFERLVVDLRSLEFMDSSGLRLLLQQSQRGDATIELIDGVAPISKLFDLTGTRELLRFVKSA